MNERLLREAMLAVCDMIEEEVGANNPHLAKVRKALGGGEGKKTKKAKGVAQ